MKGKDLLIVGAIGAGLYLLSRGGSPYYAGDQYASWRRGRSCPSGFAQIGDPLSGPQCIPTIRQSSAGGALAGVVVTIAGVQYFVVPG